MLISSFKITNYKSFRESPMLTLGPGFNVIVGQNNVGKTALAEALALRFSHSPHRSPRTVPRAGMVAPGNSRAEVGFNLMAGEIMDLLIDHIGNFLVPVNSIGELPHEAKLIVAQYFRKAVTTDATLHCHYEGGEFVLAELTSYPQQQGSTSSLYFNVDHSSRSFSASHIINSAYVPDTVTGRLASYLRDRIYYFKAERLNVSRGPFGSSPVLSSDASNLPEVLSVLQGRNPARFRKLSELVSRIIPDVRQVSVPPEDQRELEILIWTIDPTTERTDLATSLAESGTGIGQVLAILYVVVTADYPTTIIIDEPQSFLHPGALRKLIEILKGYPQHQFIITTHSPVALAAAEPTYLLLIRKVNAESTVETIDTRDSRNLRLFLSEIGASLTDAFGADYILWVEGKTEEQCFELIISELVKRPLMGTVILPVRQTGDFSGKQARTTLEIYQRLSQGRGLLPPAIGFIFDAEGKTDREREDIERQSLDDQKRPTVHFLKRRMYENYLLNPHAIAAVATDEGGRETPIAVEEIEHWLEKHWSCIEYLKPGGVLSDRENSIWRERVDGAGLLSDLWVHLFETRNSYDKVRHGVALTRWLVEHAPDDLHEVVDVLATVLDRASPEP